MIRLCVGRSYLRMNPRMKYGEDEAAEEIEDL